VTSDLWVGDSNDERYADLATARVLGVLNVAHDMQCSRGWEYGLEYMQVGLVDGPGNSLVTYRAAILALVSMLERHTVLVCCHTGGRAMAVALMYARLTSDWGWDEPLQFLRERVDEKIPAPHEAHRTAFDAIDWPNLRKMVEDR